MTDDTPTPPDPTAFMSFDLTPDEIHALASDLEAAEAFDAADHDTDAIARLVSAIKRLEHAAEDARKEHLEPALADRVGVGDTAHDLTRMEGSRRYVTDDGAAFDAVLDAGHDPREVASVNVTDLEAVLGADASDYLGETTYDYFRREG